MADNENPRRPHPRRNLPPRPLSGVQKAMQQLGVRDLREIIDKKHQEQGYSQGDNKVNPNLPPPDPSYNYLKDPSRDKPRPITPPKIVENKRQERYNASRNIQHRPKSDQIEMTPENNNLPPKTSWKKEHTTLENVPPNKKDGAQQRELHFSDTQFSRGKGSFRGRNPRRGHGTRPRENRQEQIKNPVNIKIQLSTETGQRSCTLDENTKIPDIKHIPDQTFWHRLPRGAFGGGRGNFRGRGRGRGSFRGRGGMSSRRNNTEDIEGLESLKDPDSKENGNRKKVQQKGAEIEAAKENVEAPLEQYDENEEFADSSENYNTEFSSEYHVDSVEHPQNIGETNLYEAVVEPVVEYERPEEQTMNSFDPNLVQTMTITSSKYPDGEVKREIDVKKANNENP